MQADWGLMMLSNGSNNPALLAGPALAPAVSAPPPREQEADSSVLIREAQRGDAAAFEELVRIYDRAVLRLALHITGSEQDAQDIYQEVFLRAYQSLPRFRFECSFYTWLYRITSNLCLDYLRKRQRSQKHISVMISAEGEERDALDLVPDRTPAHNPERELMSRELRSRIGRALGSLSPRERIVFDLKHSHGLRLRSIAEILKTSEGAVRNTLFRATQKLRGCLAQAYAQA
jgi:RNA polymerase sigma-70 factor, ECF subfamily